jgi:hypothetical protein
VYGVPEHLDQFRMAFKCRLEVLEMDADYDPAEFMGRDNRQKIGDPCIAPIFIPAVKFVLEVGAVDSMDDFDRLLGGIPCLGPIAPDSRAGDIARDGDHFGVLMDTGFIHGDLEHGDSSSPTAEESVAKFEDSLSGRQLA